MSHSPGTGGAEHSLATLVEEALKRDHDVLLSLPIADEQRIRELLPQSDHVSIVSHRWVRMMQGARPVLSGPLRILVATVDAVAFARWLKSSRADAVIVNSTTIPQASLAARLARIPAVTMIREAIKTNPALPSFLPKSLIAWSIRVFSHSTIAVSEYAGEQIGSATHVVHPEVPLSSILADRPERLTLHLVMAGTLSKEKGQLDAVEAVRVARDRGVEVILDLYGQAAPDRLNHLNRAIASAGLEHAVTHRGESRSMMEVFGNADLSLVCSGNEAFGRVTAESINAGTPVIGYDNGGTSEILREGGGMLCDPSPESLADAIVRLATDRALLRELRSACELRIASGGAGGTASTVLELIESVVRSRTIGQ
ncbi:glycosyltransferase family 4 protein [Microbacterium dauci]|uniref:Glycosyltransferase family 4 protein n=1 Tax=Microbacterium dauci TaxID=3048008 RepID=A0ABT6ZE63_9MICO|nr:glycosyltransferase family 4 protein [Microbacterium sp. LX3-4]MDJ1114458.1 glycosyltransferase family 4 protein [Microbacterium sp. LX3-4]